MKKIFGLVVVMSFILCLPSVRPQIVASEPEAPVEITDEFMMKQAKSLEAYRRILSLEAIDPGFLEYYGGAFLRDGDIVVNIVLGNSIDQLLITIDHCTRDLPGITPTINYVKYSYIELQSAKNLLRAAGRIYGIQSISTDIENNTIKVEVDKLYDGIVDELIKLTGIDALAVFEKNPEYYSGFTATHYITNGHYADYNEGSLSVGFAARDYTGAAGFVTAGHLSVFGAEIEDDVYYLGDHAGDIKQMEFDTQTDAMFVKCRTGIFNRWLPTKTFMNGDTYYGIGSQVWYYAINTTIYMYGARSGKTTGTITNNDFVYYIEILDIYTDDMVRATYVSDFGDSGAALTLWVYSTGSTAYNIVIGIQSSAFDTILDEENNHLIWIPGISSSSFTKMYNITEDLNLSNY